MIGAVARKLFGSANERRIRGYQPRVDAINALAANPSGRTLVMPIESAGLAGGITQALAAMQLGPAKP